MPAAHGPRSGKAVAVIGSGPDGLAAGYYLAKLGRHDVTVLEALPEPGGMLRYRLPDVAAGEAQLRKPSPMLRALDRDLGIIEAAGVRIQTDAPVYSLAALWEQGYNAIFISSSARASYPLDVQGPDAEGVPAGVGSEERITVAPGSLRAAVEGVFVGGGAALGPASAVEAIAQGREAAQAIDRFLGGSGEIDEHLAPAEILSELPPLPVETGQRFRPERRSRDLRTGPGAEVELGYSRQDAMEEASRCLRCDLQGSRS